jgi:hypothetical protein
MKFKSLPKNTLILNGHKIHSIDDLFQYITQRLSLENTMTTIEQLQEYKKQYQINHIKIRHADTFLQHESLQKKKDLLLYIQNDTV